MRELAFLNKGINLTLIDNIAKNQKSMKINMKVEY